MQVNDNMYTPLRLDAVRFVGARHTRSSFLASICDPYLASATPRPLSEKERADPASARDPNTTTLGNLLGITRSLTHQLSRFDLFSEIQPTLEESASVLAHPNDVDIVFRVREAGRYYLKTSTDVGNGEGSANVTARIRNAFGGAEFIEGNVSYGTRTRSAFRVRLDTPVRASPDTHADVSVFGAERDLSHYASCKERLSGTQLRLRVGLFIHISRSF